MKLPILMSVPHAGWKIPAEVKDICILSEGDVLEDGDEGAADIYYPLKDYVTAFVTTDIGRAIVDLNRAEDDFGKDGVIKTHTCWDVPVYQTPPSRILIDSLLEQYYHPYHKKLKALAQNVKLGIDAHTMAAMGPPVGPDSGQERPSVCISNAGFTCPRAWLESLASSLENALGIRVSLNSPFQGGYIVRTHAAEMPWIQIEYSRAAFLSNEQKSKALIAALAEWVSILSN